MRLPFTPLILLLLLVPCQGAAQAVVVSPSCGTTGTHFILSAGGLDKCPEACPESCSVFGSLTITNGTGDIAIPLGLCSTSTTVDL